MNTSVEARAIELGEYIVENGATVRSAAKRFGISKSTVPKVAATNRRNQLLSVEQLLNYNFNPKDRMLTLGFDDQNLPKDKYEFEAIIKRFRTPLINYAQNNNIEIKLFISIEFGEETHRLHLHVIVSRHGIPRSVLRKVWFYGKFTLRVYLGNMVLLDSLLNIF